MNNPTNPRYNTKFIKKTELYPAHYNPVSEPVFTGPGNHSVSQLEAICEQYKEFVHQQRFKEQIILKNGNIEIVDQVPNCREIGRLHMMSDNGPGTTFNTNCTFCGADLANEDRIRKERMDNKHEKL